MGFNIGSIIPLFTVAESKDSRDLNTHMLTAIIQGIEFSVVATAWTLYQLTKATMAILVVALCLKLFII